MSLAGGSIVLPFKIRILGLEPGTDADAANETASNVSATAISSAEGSNRSVEGATEAMRRVTGGPSVECSDDP